MSLQLLVPTRLFGDPKGFAIIAEIDGACAGKLEGWNIWRIEGSDLKLAA